MTKKIKVSELPAFNVADFINNEEDALAYIAAVLEENDPILLAAALEDVASVRDTLQPSRNQKL